MTVRGAGDRWLAGESLPGVEFAHHQEVEVMLGASEGRRGRIALLLALEPTPVYLVEFHESGGTAKVRQSYLRAS
ncbi:MAG: hypothetical protein JWO05_2650 [Gemmatimonadetes bacterium]|nr:hypothetical protein [Gemmatimonadota bacterium]